MWHEIIKASLPHLGAEGVARLSASSKHFKQLLIQQLTAGERHLARRWLLTAVQQAASCRYGKVSLEEATTFGTACSTIDWLLKTALISPEMLAQDSVQYLSIPNVPLNICEQLVKAGVRVNYEDLVSAARNCVERLHHWVQACDNVGSSATLEPSVRAVCCHTFTKSWSHSVTAETLAGHLHLAINAFSSNCSRAHQAAVDRAFSTLSDWSLTQGLRQQLTADAVLQLLQSAVIILATRGIQLDPTSTSCLKFLCDMLEAVADRQNVDTTSVAGLLTTASKHRLRWCHFWNLLHIPEVQQLPPEAVHQLLLAELHSAAAHDCRPMPVVLHQICMLPAAQDMSPTACAEIFQALIDLGDNAVGINTVYTWLPATYYHGAMWSLPGVLDMGAANVIKLLQHVIDIHSNQGLEHITVEAHMECLCDLPAAADISKQEFQQLLNYGAAAGVQDSVTDFLMGLPVATHLSRQVRTSLKERLQHNQQQAAQ